MFCEKEKHLPNLFKTRIIENSLSVNLNEDSQLVLDTVAKILKSFDVKCVNDLLRDLRLPISIRVKVAASMSNYSGLAMLLDQMTNADLNDKLFADCLICVTSTFVAARRWFTSTRAVEKINNIKFDCDPNSTLRMLLKIWEQFGGRKKACIESKSNRNPLHLLANQEYLNKRNEVIAIGMIKLLLPVLGTDALLQPDLTGCSPLHLTAKNCHAKIFAVLFDSLTKEAIDSSALTIPNSSTCLHLAASAGAADICRIILRLGEKKFSNNSRIVNLFLGNRYSIDANGCTPGQVAKNRGIMQLLKCSKNRAPQHVKKDNKALIEKMKSILLPTVRSGSESRVSTLTEKCASELRYTSRSLDSLQIDIDVASTLQRFERTKEHVVHCRTVPYFNANDCAVRHSDLLKCEVLSDAPDLDLGRKRNVTSLGEHESAEKNDLDIEPLNDTTDLDEALLLLRVYRQSVSEEAHNYNDDSGAFLDENNEPRIVRQATSINDKTGYSTSETILNEVQGMAWKQGNLIGRGSYGQVHRGMLADGRIVAVKTIRVEMDAAPSKLDRAIREIRILNSLTHANIVQYIDCRYRANEDTGKGTVHIFMEFLSGGSLAALVKCFGPLAPSVQSHYTGQIVDGLRYLHRNNIIHRDIKGANVMLASEGTVKLVDFGGARILPWHENAISASEPLTRSFLGSPYWVAPEVLQEEGGHVFASDVWSLGCTMIELATGSPPWHHLNPQAALHTIADCSSPAPRLDENEFDRALCDFVRACLQREPHLRANIDQLSSLEFLI